MNRSQDRQVVVGIVEKYYPDIIKVATALRQKFVAAYGEGIDLAGKCVAASEALYDELTKRGYKCKVVEGWCWHEFNTGSEYPYDAHTWLQVYGLNRLNRRVLYVDITGDQFSYCLGENRLAGVEIGPVPSCMHRGKPNRDYLKYIGC